MEEELLEPGVDIEDEEVAEDASFAREEAAALYIAGYLDVNPHRWLRAREEIRFEDVVERLTGFTSQVISCPFHGRDSTPSFHVYRRGNDGFCFGCPPGKGYYDSVIFTSEKLGISRVKALSWLEKEYHLPPMADLDPSEIEDLRADEPLFLTFRDLLGPYIEHARRDIQTAQDVDLAREYLEILFDAWPTRAEEKINPDAGDPLPLARVLGKSTVTTLLHQKAR